MKSHALSWRDGLLALVIMFIWGTNFVVIHVALDVLPPLLMAGLRFTLVLLPLVFFLPRPAPWRHLAAYGVFVGVGQFGLIFIALDGRISPGLASLVIQMQVFFTILLSMVRNGERLRPHQFVAFALAIAGMLVIMFNNGHGATVAGVLLVVTASASWALGNQAAKEAGAVNMLGFVVWASLFSVPPLFVLSLLLEGWPAIISGLGRASPAIWAGVVWQSVGNTMFGYGYWAWLLSRYPAATVAPMSLLVPLFGFGASALWLGEPLQPWKIVATALVMGGLAINLLWRRTSVEHGEPV